MWTKKFWQAVAERVLSTAAQAALGVIISAASLGEIDWRVVGGTVGLAVLVSLLKNVLTAAVTDGSPSLSGSEIVTPPAAIVTPVSPSDPFTVAGNGQVVYSPGNGDEPTTSTL